MPEMGLKKRQKVAETGSDTAQLRNAGNGESMEDHGSA